MWIAKSAYGTRLTLVHLILGFRLQNRSWISPGCPARVSGWRVSVTTCVWAETRRDSRRLAADAICQEEASAPFIARHASNWNRRTCSDEQGHWRPPPSIGLEYNAPHG